MTNISSTTLCVCPSDRPVQAHVTRKSKSIQKYNICANVRRNRSNQGANFQRKRSKAKVIRQPGRNRPTEIDAYLAKVYLRLADGALGLLRPLHNIPRGPKKTGPLYIFPNI